MARPPRQHRCMSVAGDAAVIDAYLAALVAREDIAPFFSEDIVLELVDVGQVDPGPGCGCRRHRRAARADLRCPSGDHQPHRRRRHGRGGGGLRRHPHRRVRRHPRHRPGGGRAVRGLLRPGRWRRSRRCAPSTCALATGNGVSRPYLAVPDPSRRRNQVHELMHYEACGCLRAAGGQARLCPDRGERRRCGRDLSPPGWTPASHRTRRGADQAPPTPGAPRAPRRSPQGTHGRGERRPSPPTDTA